KGFIRFLVQYNLYKLGKGILYNLKFPGFKKIRKLFVKESTVMEHNNYYTAGTILFKEGESGKKFYLLKKGSIEICKHTSAGEKITLSFVESGEIFGEMAILGNQPRSASAVCMTNCVVATADGDNLEALIKGNPDFSLKLIQTLATRISYSEKLLKSRIQELEDALNHEKEKNHKLETKVSEMIPKPVDLKISQHSKFRKRRKT
ncbi:MAG TPA: cyclic nucleotide-binding domain-containing protein, partial [Leptospiraceae bacterium]|nr:cyclic nucleotide-binding domain-containing protein [Leptospiraceae bacterium]